MKAARLRKSRVKAETEAFVQEQVAATLRLQGKPGLLWWHTPNNPRSAVSGARLRRWGMLKGVSDILILYKGTFYALELKTEKGAASKEQMEFWERVRENGGHATIAYGFEQALQRLRGWGVLR